MGSRDLVEVKSGALDSGLAQAVAPMKGHHLQSAGHHQVTFTIASEQSNREPVRVSISVQSG